MRLRVRCGAHRSGSRRVFRAGVWGVSWPVPSRSFHPVPSSCRVGLFRSWLRGGVGWSGSPWPLGLTGDGCGPRRGRSRRRWSGSRRGPPRSRRLGRAGSVFRWRCGGLLALRVRSSASRCRWPCRRRCGWPLRRCGPLRSRGCGPLSRSEFPPGSSRRRCRRRWRDVSVTAPVLPPAARKRVPEPTAGLAPHGKCTVEYQYHSTGWHKVHRNICHYGRL